MALIKKGRLSNKEIREGLETLRDYLEEHVHCRKCGDFIVSSDKGVFNIKESFCEKCIMKEGKENLKNAYKKKEKKQ